MVGFNAPDEWTLRYLQFEVHLDLPECSLLTYYQYQFVKNVSSSKIHILYELSMIKDVKRR